MPLSDLSNFTPPLHSLPLFFSSSFVRVKADLVVKCECVVALGLSTVCGSPPGPRQKAECQSRRSKTVPLEPAGSDPPAKCSVCSRLPVPEPPDELLSKRSTVCFLWCFFLRPLQPISAANSVCYSVIRCFMSHTATSWLSSTHTHTHRICQQDPGWKLLRLSCCVAPHVFSGIAETCAILKIWDRGGTLVTFCPLRRKWHQYHFTCVRRSWFTAWCDHGKTMERVIVLIYTNYYECRTITHYLEVTFPAYKCS